GISRPCAVPGSAEGAFPPGDEESDPLQRIARSARAAGTQFRPAVRRGAVRRRAEDLQARAAGLRARRAPSRHAEGAHRLRLLQWLGRARRLVVWFWPPLGQSMLGGVCGVAY